MGITAYPFGCFITIRRQETAGASKEFKAGADEVKREIEDAASSVEDDNEN